MSFIERLQGRKCALRSDARLIQLFHAVAERLSFSRAAEDLHIAQPWLSSQIRKLENQLGFELFFRTSRRVELTEQGLALLDRAQKVDAALNTFHASARCLSHAKNKVLRIGLPEYSHHFPTRVAFIERFSREQQHLTMEVEAGWTPFLLDRLRDGTLDLTFAIGNNDFNDLDVKLISNTNMLFLVRADNPLAALAALPAEAARGQDVVAFPRAHNPCLHDTLFNGLAECGARLRILPEQNLDINIRHVLEFNMIGLIFDQPLPTIVEDKLVKLPASPEPITLPLFLARRREDQTLMANTFWKQATLLATGSTGNASS
jgi:DNA-binding transcriptional LysR family regulator